MHRVVGAMLIPRLIPEVDLGEGYGKRSPTDHFVEQGGVDALIDALEARNDELQECTLAAMLHLVAAHPEPSRLLVDEEASARARAPPNFLREDETQRAENARAPTAPTAPRTALRAPESPSNARDARASFDS